MSILLVQWNVVGLETIFFVIIHENNIKLKKYYTEKFRETTGIEIQSQNWGGNRQLPMEGIVVEYFPNSIDPGNI